MKVIDIVSVLDSEQPIVITGDFAAGMLRTEAGDVPVSLLAKRIKRVYPQEYNNEIVIETVSK